jgi:hypothetical protein
VLEPYLRTYQNANESVKTFFTVAGTYQLIREEKPEKVSMTFIILPAIGLKFSKIKKLKSKCKSGQNNFQSILSEVLKKLSRN